ncbi:MAG: response regulator [Chloroflexi bacterium]|nr:MAG: response regulator [Chloroflexota bacterium]
MSAVSWVRRWLLGAPGRNDLERRQAVLLQTILVALLALVAVTSIVTAIMPGLGSAPDAIRGFLIVEPLFLIPLWLLRRGWFTLAASATVLVIEFIVVVAVLAVGPGTPGTGVAFAIPMTIAALVLRRPGLIAVTFASVAVVLVGNALPLRTPVTSGAVLNLLVTLSVLGLILDRFGVTLRDSLGREMSQRHDLEEARDDLAVQAENLSKANERLRLEMTERQEAEAARRAIEAKVLEVQKLESLGVLAGGIAHDFNNLLVGILGNASLALLDLPEDSPARQSVVDIERAGQRAGELARQMLAYSGRSRLQIEPVELSELVRDLLTLLQVSIGKGVAIRLDLPDEPVVVDADAAQIRQVVMNLVINAADAIGNRTGKISIRVHHLQATADYLSDTHPGAGLEPGHFAALEVTDTGTGMDEATRTRMFDPFFTTKFAGRGLGLAAVLGIVRGHHGALRVYSEVGHGTTFRIVLPLSASSPIRTTSPDGAWHGSGRVLVVDDDAMVRTVARRLLESFGLTVEDVAGGPAAIDRLRADPAGIDVVLLDLTMPEMNGPELLTELRAIRPDLPAVVMSGYHEDEATAALGAPISGFVQKPFTPVELARQMRAALEPAAEPAGEPGAEEPKAPAAPASLGQG